MKKIMIGIGATILVAGAVAFKNVAPGNKSDVPEKTGKVTCPPECGPDDDCCIYAQECDK